MESGLREPDNLAVNVVDWHSGDMGPIPGCAKDFLSDLRMLLNLFDSVLHLENGANNTSFGLPVSSLFRL